MSIAICSVKPKAKSRSYIARTSFCCLYHTVVRALQMVIVWSIFGQKIFQKSLDITLILAYNKSIKRGETQGGKNNDEEYDERDPEENQQW